MVCKYTVCAQEFVAVKNSKGGPRPLFCSIACRLNAARPRNAQARREKYHRSPERMRADRLWRFKITPQDYTAMLIKQNGGCGICEARDNGERGGKPLPFCVDHDHACCPGWTSCGKCVRGLLCSTCNQAIGLLNDRISLCQSAAAYIQSYTSPEHGL